MGIEIDIKDLNQHPSVKIVELKGELDIVGSREFTRKMLPVIEEGNFYLIVDLSNLQYINSTGIYSLMRCFTKVKENGGFLKLVEMNERVKEILEVIGITKLIPSYNTLDEALMETE